MKLKILNSQNKFLREGLKRKVYFKYLHHSNGEKGENRESKVQPTSNATNYFKEIQDSELSLNLPGSSGETNQQAGFQKPLN